ncbi:hypothetical protein M501DRAFT_240161 [Patellaria atrata CBS 101060]|uniref:pH-response regulator protein palC n=1 Tax=Patellaria atrata CBS 101060 TaxID=1346257 RepID=A0A9P4S591_9PEZI|nr:hypothetical protein M501DRAFT_240161 [Patellaria atrata CBS 101060]
MPYPFTLPTTSHISFSDFFSSSTHPSLPLSATTSRGVLRDALKRHKRLPLSSQASNLPSILAALNEYIPYLLALDNGLSGQNIANEEIDVVLQNELIVEWRTTLSSTIPGREPPRVKLRSLEVEIFFVLTTLAETYILLARSQLHALYNPSAFLSPEQRTAAIAAAMKHLLDANAAHAYLVARSQHSHSPPATGPPDISPPLHSALAALSLAEATLIAVLKDDPYPSVVADARNKENKDWMFKAPSIPKVRAHLFARLCIAASEHAARAAVMLGRVKGVDEGLIKYVDDLRRTAKARACRFFGIDAEAGGATAEGIAWLRGAKGELGIMVGKEGEEGKVSGLSKLKKGWQERREDKRVEKGGEWGIDAGKAEEGRVVEMLEVKWVKQNDMISTSPIPPIAPLLSRMPTGREYHQNPPIFHPPSLDADIITRMRAPPDPSGETFKSQEADSADEDEEGRGTPIGAFPGTSREYDNSTPGYY